MFYLENASRRFFLGFIEKDSSVFTVVEGTREKGVCSKEEMLCASPEDAWYQLSALVCRKRATASAPVAAVAATPVAAQAAVQPVAQAPVVAQAAPVQQKAPEVQAGFFL